MNINFWGTRGSVPVSGSQYVRHGGQTTCLSVEVGDALWIIDCGTGLVQLGRNITHSSFDILQTHLHWDHIQGFPFFAPIFNPASEITLHALARDGDSMHDALKKQMTQPTFPVPLDIAPAALRFETIATKGRKNFDAMTLTWTEVVHPSGCTAYRFETDEGIFVFTADVEALDCFDLLVEFCEGADVMVMDAQYFPGEYETRRGWGHSTYEHAIEVAMQACVGSLYLTHHDPSHDDQRLHEKLRAAHIYAGRRISVDNAYDGLRLELGKSVTNVAA